MQVQFLGAPLSEHLGGQKTSKIWHELRQLLNLRDIDKWKMVL